MMEPPPEPARSSCCSPPALRQVSDESEPVPASAAPGTASAARVAMRERGMNLDLIMGSSSAPTGPAAMGWPPRRGRGNPTPLGRADVGLAELDLDLDRATGGRLEEIDGDAAVGAAAVADHGVDPARGQSDVVEAQRRARHADGDAAGVAGLVG